MKNAATSGSLHFNLCIPAVGQLEKFLLTRSCGFVYDQFFHFAQSYKGDIHYARQFSLVRERGNLSKRALNWTCEGGLYTYSLKNLISSYRKLMNYFILLFPKQFFQEFRDFFKNYVGHFKKFRATGPRLPELSEMEKCLSIHNYSLRIAQPHQLVTNTLKLSLLQ